MEVTHNGATGDTMSSTHSSRVAEDTRRHPRRYGGVQDSTNAEGPLA